VRAMKSFGQGSLFDEPGESKRLHRLHGAPTSGHGGCWLYVGPTRWRGETNGTGGSGEQLPAFRLGSDRPRCRRSRRFPLARRQ
jgi:hypothetical protein